MVPTTARISLYCQEEQKGVKQGLCVQLQLSCSLIGRYHFGETYCLHLQGLSGPGCESGRLPTSSIKKQAMESRSNLSELRMKNGRLQC